MGLNVNKLIVEVWYFQIFIPLFNFRLGWSRFWQSTMDIRTLQTTCKSKSNKAYLCFGWAKAACHCPTFSIVPCVLFTSKFEGWYIMPSIAVFFETLSGLKSLHVRVQKRQKTSQMIYDNFDWVDTLRIWVPSFDLKKTAEAALVMRQQIRGLKFGPKWYFTEN